jgi:RNA polymerase sigma-70 factor (ECF subfamily)
MPPPDSELGRWFATHVQPHEAMLRAWLHQRFESRVDIDDIVQEAFVRTLHARTARTARTLASPKAFLFTTARNLALDRLRRHEVSRTDFLGGNRHPARLG